VTTREEHTVPLSINAETVPPKSSGRYWVFIAAIAPVVIALAAVYWSHLHPFGTNWDESIYLNEVQVDTQRLQGGMLLKLAGRTLIKSYGRPPAYRFLSVPFLAAFGYHTTTARLVSIACFGLSAWLIYLTARRIGSPTAGAFAALIFCLSPQIVSASIWFGTEGPLYVATAAILYYVCASWSGTPEESRAWLGIGLAMGLGLLAKVSFVAIGFPLLVYWVVMDRSGYLGPSKPTWWWKTGLLALIVAAPWWVPNIKYAIESTESARGFVRHSLGPLTFATLIKWSSSVVQSLFGYGLTILIVLVVIAFLRKAFLQRETILNPSQRAALGACACAGVPIIIAQLTGTNHLLRHISPSVIPLAIAIGIIADRTGWVRSRTAGVISSILLYTQLLMIVVPVLFPNNHEIDRGLVNGVLPWRIMVRHEQWDWDPVLRISQGCGLHAPKISYLGGGESFNQPAIEFPWAANVLLTHVATADYPQVESLKKFSEAIDWQKMMNSASQSDLVITAPGYIGRMDVREGIDNGYNAEFADRLSHDPRFQGPVRLQMGRFKPIEVDVFLNSSLRCHSGLPASATY